MEVQELRSLSVEELKGRIKQWKDDLFRARFKAFSSEVKDTSVFGKLKRDVARASTILTEKNNGIVVQAPTAKPVAKKAAADTVVEDKPVEAKAKKSTKAASTKKKSKE